jgi:hypothetical protein
LTNSAKSKISISAETLFQLVRCGPMGLPAPANRSGSSDPLVGDLRLEGTDQGADGFGS